VIRLDVPQGSKAWFDARIGLPTASQYSRILTPRTMKVSEQAVGYRNELLAEWLLGEPLDTGEFQFTERGSSLEEGAYRFYEMQREVDVDRVGFLLRDDRRTGCSPDGLVGTDGQVEIKCPAAATHVGYLLDGGGEKYRAQIQGGLYISGRPWCDFLSYHPTLPPAMVRFQRDEPFIRALEAVLNEFCDRLATAQAELAARGYQPAAKAEPSFFAGVG